MHANSFILPFGYVIERLKLRSPIIVGGHDFSRLIILLSSGGFRGKTQKIIVS